MILRLEKFFVPLPIYITKLQGLFGFEQPSCRERHSPKNLQEELSHFNQSLFNYMHHKIKKIPPCKKCVIIFRYLKTGISWYLRVDKEVTVSFRNGKMGSNLCSSSQLSISGPGWYISMCSLSQVTVKHPKHIVVFYSLTFKKIPQVNLSVGEEKQLPLLMSCTIPGSMPHSFTVCDLKMQPSEEKLLLYSHRTKYHNPAGRRRSNTTCQCDLQDRHKGNFSVANWFFLNIHLH